MPSSAASGWLATNLYGHTDRQWLKKEFITCNVKQATCMLECLNGAVLLWRLFFDFCFYWLYCWLSVWLCCLLSTFCGFEKNIKFAHPCFMHALHMQLLKYNDLCCWRAMSGRFACRMSERLAVSAVLTASIVCHHYMAR